MFSMKLRKSGDLTRVLWQIVFDIFWETVVYIFFKVIDLSLVFFLIWHSLYWEEVWYIYWTMFIIRFLKVLCLDQGIVANCLIYLLGKSFLYIFGSDSLVFGHICTKMFRSSKFSIFAICLIYILANCLRWSFSKSHVGPGFCGQLFDKIFCRKLSTYFQGNCLILGHIGNDMFS